MSLPSSKGMVYVSPSSRLSSLSDTLSVKAKANKIEINSSVVPTQMFWKNRKRPLALVFISLHLLLLSAIAYADEKPNQVPPGSSSRRVVGRKLRKKTRNNGLFTRKKILVNVCQIKGKRRRRFRDKILSE